MLLEVKTVSLSFLNLVLHSLANILSQSSYLYLKSFISSYFFHTYKPEELWDKFLARMWSDSQEAFLPSHCVFNIFLLFLFFNFMLTMPIVI